VANLDEARRLIDLHRVLVNGTIADKATRQVDPGDAVLISAEPARFVSRGGEKLDHALERFGIDVNGVFALDAGASTGGFSDCLLQRGAAHVVALDVGHGQLHPRIRGDERVTVIERFNVRQVQAEQLGATPAVIVADLSFISLTKVIPALVRVGAPGTEMVLLVKPQFEADRLEVSKGRGVITDPIIHERVRNEVAAALESAGCEVIGWCDSPLTGSDGNHEYLVNATVTEGVPTR
jgi:23S rRNA (cytidine1920-2'-O)/16S rRNA (cytidine1409-2'-O)-methyltransferase